MKSFAEYPPGVLIDFPGVFIPGVDELFDELDESDEEDPGVEVLFIFFNKFAKHAVGHPQLEPFPPFPLLVPALFDELDEPLPFEFPDPGVFNPGAPEPFPSFKFI